MRLEKQAIQKEVVARLEKASFAFLLNYTGLSVAAITALRRVAKKHKARVQVVKNTQLEKALATLGWQSVAAYLKGPTAVVAGTGDAAEMAKDLAAFIKAQGKSAVKGVCLDSKAFGSADFVALTMVPPRPVMLGLFVGTLAAPMMGLVGVFNQKVLSLLYVLKAVEEKKTKAA